MDELLPDQFGDRFTAKAIDRHHLAANEMLDPADDLRRARMLVGTIVLGLTFVAHQCSATFRTAAGEHHGLGALFVHLHPHDLGDDLAPLLHLHPITDVEAQLGDLVGVVQ